MWRFFRLLGPDQDVVAEIIKLNQPSPIGRKSSGGKKAVSKPVMLFSRPELAILLAFVMTKGVQHEFTMEFLWSDTLPPLNYIDRRGSPMLVSLQHCIELSLSRL